MSTSVSASVGRDVPVEAATRATASASAAIGLPSGRVWITCQLPDSLRRGTTPARTNELLPAPDGPTTSSTAWPRRRSTNAVTSRSRPKKRSACRSVNAERPRNGLSEGAGACCRASIAASPSRTSAAVGRSAGAFRRQRMISAARSVGIDWSSGGGPTGSSELTRAAIWA